MLKNPRFHWNFRTLLDDWGEKNGDPYGIRTRVVSVKGICPRPLDEGVVQVESLEVRSLYSFADQKSSPKNTQKQNLRDLTS